MHPNTQRLISIFSLFLASALISPPISALTLKIATLAPAGTTWMKEIKKGAKKVRSETQGRVKLKFYPGGVMGNDKSVHRKIRIGQLHGGAFSSSALSHVDSAIAVLSLPMVFHSFDEVDYVRAKMDERIKQHVAENGFVILGISEGGFARVLSSKPLRNLQDMRSSKVWLPEGDMLVYETFKTMGIKPISLPLSDVFTGLQTGLIETVATTSAGAIAFQWHSNIKYMVDIPVLYIIGVLAVDRRTFDKIEPNDQDVVIRIMNDVFKNLDRLNRKSDIAATEALKTQGISVISPSPEEVHQWQSLSDQSVRNMVDSGSLDKAIFDEMMEHLTDFRK